MPSLVCSRNSAWLVDLDPVDVTTKERLPIRNPSIPQPYTPGCCYCYYYYYCYCYCYYYYYYYYYHFMNAANDNSD